MHVLNRYQREFEVYLRRNAGLIVLLSVLFVIGVVFGGLAVGAVGDHDKAELVTYLSQSFERIVHPASGEGWMIFKLSLIRSAKILAGLWLVGITLLALPCTAVGAVVWGFVSGFTVSFFTAQMGWSGLAVAVAGHLPHSLVSIPALIIGGTASAAFSSQVVRSWAERRRLHNFYPTLARFTGTLLAVGVALLAAGLLEAYLSPALARLAAAILHLS
ncbi:MAG TPA: stage II sporulation protein M [Symbiobacteriaceae bacterium]|nr:stage II sporulation protein M [Symbiobacteriaceae bacterium]